jgi:hypothetical protein
MSHRKFARALPALAVAALLVAPPALAAPSPDAGAPARIVHLLAEWWGALTRPLVSVFAADGAPPTAEAADGPTDGTEHRQEIDPNG